MQDALATDLKRWPKDGVPNNSAAWIVTVARNKAIDRLRRDRRRTEKYVELAEPAASEPNEFEMIEDFEDTSLHDDRLRLLFTCCHPALGLESQVALTLRIAFPDTHRRSRQPAGPRGLAGKPLAGFRATPDRRIIVLCGMIVSVIRFNNPLLHR